MKRLLRRIKGIARKPHFFGRLWRWAVKPGYAAKRRRLKALISWSRDHWHLARSKDRKHKFWKAGQAYRRKRRLLKKHHKPDHPPSDGDNFTSFDGKPVPDWIYPWLQKARASGRWHGVLVSGYRTPAYSEQLCYGICGAPSCPGRCAGRSSNHCCPPSFTGQPYEGAVDVSDYYAFGQVMASFGYPLVNHLPSDPVHYSKTGY